MQDTVATNLQGSSLESINRKSCNLSANGTKAKKEGIRVKSSPSLSSLCSEFNMPMPIPSENDMQKSDGAGKDPLPLYPNDNPVVLRSKLSQPCANGTSKASLFVNAEDTTSESQPQTRCHAADPKSSFTTSPPLTSASDPVTEHKPHRGGKVSSTTIAHASSVMHKSTILTAKSSKKQKQQSNKEHSAQPPLRRGKWTPEEEAYVSRVISDFNSGYLRTPAGTTLRTYLSEKLHCDPMRITKKFTGDACIGKRVFHPAVRCASNAADIDKAQAELDVLEQQWRRRLEMQKKDSSKKAGRHLKKSAAPLTTIAVGCAPAPSSKKIQPLQEVRVVSRTAAWLDRASTVLVSHTGNSNDKSVSDVESQINEVKQLIHEGPIIQQSLVDGPHKKVTRHSVDSRVEVSSISSSQQHNHLKKSKSETGLSTCLGAPGDSAECFNSLLAAKRKLSAETKSFQVASRVSKRNDEHGTAVADNRKSECADDQLSSSASHTDVEALVGFLNCVRKESMAGRVNMQ